MTETISILFEIILIVVKTVCGFLMHTVFVVCILAFILVVFIKQWIYYYNEYKNSKELCWLIIKDFKQNDNKNDITYYDLEERKKIMSRYDIDLDKIVFDTVFFEYADVYFQKTIFIQKDQHEMAKQMNELECENLKTKIERIKENNTMTISLIAIGFSVMALLISLSSKATTLSVSMIALICLSSFFFIIVQLEQHILKEIRITTKVFQYNFKQIERIWLEKQ